MGILKPDIDTEITPERLKELGFEFHIANVVLMRLNELKNALTDNLDKTIDLLKKFSFYSWRHPEYKYKYQPLTVRYYPETSVVDGFYNDAYVKFAGCIVAFQHSASNICVYQKVNDIMDIEVALSEIEIHKNKILRGEI